MRTPPTISFAVTHPDGTSETIERDGGLGEYFICRKTIGQTANEHNVVIDDPRISRRHCAVIWDGESIWRLRDLGSTNGTWVGGNSVEADVQLENGTEIRLGDSIVQFRLGPAGDAPWHPPAVGSIDREDGATVVNLAPSPEGNDDATTVNLPHQQLHVDNGNETVVNIEPGNTGDDTMANTGSENSSDDAAVASPTDDDATTVNLPPQQSHMDSGDETVVNIETGQTDDAAVENSGSEGLGNDATAAPPTDDDATAVNLPPQQSHVDSDDETVVNTEPEQTGDATMANTGGEKLGEDATIAGEATMAGEAADGADTDTTVMNTPSSTADSQAAETAPDSAPETDTQTSPPPAESEATIIRTPVSAPEPRPSGGNGATAPGITLLTELQSAGLLTTDQARAVELHAKSSGQTVFQTIVHDGHLTNQDQIQAWAAERAGCRRVESSEALQEDVRQVEWLRLNAAEKAGVLMLRSGDGGAVEYAATDPFDILTRDWVARCEESITARPVLVTPAIFTDTVRRLRRDENEDDEGEIGVAIEIDWNQAEQVKENLEGHDVPMIVDYIIFRAHALGASDIHIEPTETSLLIRNRVDGILHEEAVLPDALHPEVASRIKILSGMDVAEKRRPQDGRIAIKIRQSPIDVRVSTFPTVYGEKIVMRLLDQSSLMPSPDHLGLRPRELRMLIDGLSAPYGLIMLCGPTGSGKTTTLYSCLGAIDKTTKNVLTVEDPVEYRLEGVHQMQVNHKIGLTFQQGLRNILRQDPDIIMVGECRDLETAEMAIQASLTGHIVFSTIHTNDAIGVVSRLLDMEIDPFLVATALSLAIAQRLVRTICPECKTQVDGADVIEKLRTDGVSDAKLQTLGIEIDPDLQYAMGRGRGCGFCRGTGYSGRQAVFEVFEMTNECRQIVMGDQYNADELREVAVRDGLSTLVQSGLNLVEQGITTHEEVIRVLGETN